jgi:hypothetical protein
MDLCILIFKILDGVLVTNTMNSNVGSLPRFEYFVNRSVPEIHVRKQIQCVDLLVYV